MAHWKTCSKGRLGGVGGLGWKISSCKQRGGETGKILIENVPLKVGELNKKNTGEIFENLRIFFWGGELERLETVFLVDELFFGAVLCLVCT